MISNSHIDCIQYQLGGGGGVPRVRLIFRPICDTEISELISAIPMYEQFGFSYLPGPLGNSGHTGCDIWMIKLL